MIDSKRSMSPLALVLILSAVFFALFLSISGVLLIYKSPGGLTGSFKGSASSSIFSKGGVGVIEMNGIIMDSKKTLAKLDRFEENDQIKAVVLRLNSPGGAVAPSQEIYESVRKYKKPIVVSMASVAASGAYYIACGAQKIFANSGSMTGSIGVIMEFANLEKLYNWAKIQRYVIKSGKFKDVGAEFRHMTEEEKSVMQSMVNDILKQFKSAVAQGRNLTMAQVDAVADGRIFSGTQAKEAHLVDEIGTLKDAIQEAAKMAHIQGKPTVIYPAKQRRSVMDYLMDDSDSNENVEASSSSGRFASQLFGFLKYLGQSENAQLKEFVPGLYWVWGGVTPAAKAQME